MADYYHKEDRRWIVLFVVILTFAVNLTFLYTTSNAKTNSTTQAQPTIAKVVNN